MTELLVITLGCFLAAFINAAFATGGVYIMLAFMSAVLPITITIQLLPAFALPSLLARILLFWQHIDWKIAKSFFGGAVIGVFLGGQIFVNLSEGYICLLIGCLILLFTWAPHISLPLPKSNVFLFAGTVHSFIGTLFGIGGIIQSLVVRTELIKAQVTGTLAACLFSMGLLKLTSYLVNGFSYEIYWLHICAAIAAGFIGAWLGKRTSIAISDKLFRNIFKIITTLVAGRLLFKAVVALN
ncbi:sulfite exporter TauE/SafE family protein [Paraglaciecola arctica]|uniref:sulfite exporter TauE/SafE family protein n=1 Tax=Paraglaciecola arctica TaxID=1128911 RepID=UPI001C07440D|nr:sulfite exporter TauE/SafE family protein [Paraglaciecola arctica]MBU3002963.1 sulfite exporter TauE/SafE family protein [Paraglaciecola arctica]